MAALDTHHQKRAKASPFLDSLAIQGAKKASLPEFVEPMLASLLTAPPAGKDWIHEIKFDGYRLQARIEAGRVKLLTRRGLDWTQKFGPKIVTILQALPVETALIDGELVVENSSGVSDFSALQAALSEGQFDRFLFYAFDLLYLDGYDLCDLSLSKRRDMLEHLVGSDAGPLRMSQRFEEEGRLVLQHACRLGLEGIISKRKESVYRSGRGKDWIKSKCSARQEFVIAGYVPSSTSRKAIGSLVLGVYDGDRLDYVGRVGTGFTMAIAEDLFRKLEAMQIDKRPFAKPLASAEARHVRYVHPELVAEIEFSGWTADERLRHASFQGLREDKDAREVVREGSRSLTFTAKPQRRRAVFTHSDRIYWPDEGVTKEGLADYYTEVWRFIAPFIVGRPLALLRCPDGITGPQFFQKHAWKKVYSHLVLVNDPKEKSEPLLALHDLDGLLELVQSAVLEIHPWQSTLTDWERPDRIIMDLDPGEGVPWEMVIAAAEEMRDRLQEVGLAAFVKTSGGKGLHVVSPLNRWRLGPW